MNKWDATKCSCDAVEDAYDQDEECFYENEEQQGERLQQLAIKKLQRELAAQRKKKQQNMYHEERQSKSRLQKAEKKLQRVLAAKEKKERQDMYHEERQSKRFLLGIQKVKKKLQRELATKARLNEKEERATMNYEDQRSKRWKRFTSKSVNYIGVTKIDIRNKVYNPKVKLWSARFQSPFFFLFDCFKVEDAARARDSFVLNKWKNRTRQNRNISLNFAAILIIAFEDEDNEQEHIVRDHPSIFGRLIAVPVSKKILSSSSLSSLPSSSASFRLFDPTKVSWRYSKKCLTGKIDVHVRATVAQHFTKRKLAAEEAEKRRKAIQLEAAKLGCWSKVPATQLFGQHLLSNSKNGVFHVSLIKLFQKHPLRDRLIQLATTFRFQSCTTAASTISRRDPGILYLYRTSSIIADENLRGQWMGQYRLFTELVKRLQMDYGITNSKPKRRRIAKKFFMSSSSSSTSSSAPSSSSLLLREQLITKICKQRFPCFRCFFYDYYELYPYDSVDFINVAMLSWERQQHRINKRRKDKKLKHKRKRENEDGGESHSSDLTPMVSSSSSSSKKKKTKIGWKKRIEKSTRKK
jgi:hypothetical protein